MTQWAALLAGGSGTRFWPLSTPHHPKQFLPLVGDQPLLVQSVARLHGLVPPERILVITGSGLVAETRRLLPHVPAENVLAEPRAASTGPALAWATAVAGARDPAAAVLSLHADWFVGDDPQFRNAAARALEIAARHDVLVTVGIVPSRPEVGYGYIEPGDPIEGDARRVRRFVEKPDEDRARELIAAGALWNSGLFAWTATRFHAETLALAPEMAPHLERLATGDVDGFFARVVPVAVDVSHFERSARVAVVPGAFRWDDVGTWAALRRVRTADAAGNVLVGAAHQRDASGCVIWSEDGVVVVDGVSDAVVVRANGVTLVTTAQRAGHLKTLLERLPADVRHHAD
ncbi:MAG TPA: sugar phosphate nucleotidyltransferase [Gemmatimonadales bacterium]